jgi:hypothetical protein
MSGVEVEVGDFAAVLLDSSVGGEERHPAETSEVPSAAKAARRVIDMLSGRRFGLFG